MKRISEPDIPWLAKAWALMSAVGIGLLATGALFALFLGVSEILDLFLKRPSSIDSAVHSVCLAIVICSANDTSISSRDYRIPFNALHGFVGSLLMAYVVYWNGDQKLWGSVEAALFISAVCMIIVLVRRRRGHRVQW
jgi:hypothetical protein